MNDFNKYLPNLVSLQKIVRIVGISSGIFLASCTDAVHVDRTKELQVSHQQITDDRKILTEYQKARNSKIPEEIAALQAGYIMYHADKAGIDYTLLVGMIETETLFNATATSSVGAAGLMQLYRAETEIDPAQVYDLEYNIETGIKVLKEKWKGKTLTEALDAYSGGAKDYSSKVYMNLGRYVMFKSNYRSN